jgi:Galactose oxidase, central domain
MSLGAAISLASVVSAPGAQAAAATWAFSTQKPSAAAPSGRVFDAAAGAPNGLSGIFYGGEVPAASSSGTETPLADTWVNDATGWHPRCGTSIAGATSPCGPGPRTLHGMGTGPTGTILFGGFAGGFGGTQTGDTWRWTGAHWVQVCSTLTCGPGPRALLAMAGNGQRAVLYGGFNGTTQTVQDDTWVFDGATWSQLCGAGAPTACGPGPRAGSSLAWDGKRFVLFGGQATLAGSGVPRADTWILSGNHWTRVCGTATHPCGPSGRILGAFGYARDPRGVSGAVLANGGNLFGNGAHTLYRDAWFWNNASRSWRVADAPWTGAPITFSGSGEPPVNSAPLVGVIAAEPARCTLVYRSTHVTGADPTFTLATHTYLARPSTAPAASGTGCTAAPATPRKAAHARVEPTLAATGAPTSGLLAAALTLVVAGGLCIHLGRSRRDVR